MRKYFLVLFLFNYNSLFSQEFFQLAPPILKYNSVFFSNSTSVEIKFAQNGTAVHYTLNNMMPTMQDLIYKWPIIIKNNFTVIMAKAFGNSFSSSETVSATFIKEGKKIQSIQYTQPNIKYPGSGSNTLIDNKGGIEQISSANWMGYYCDTVSITLDLEKQQTLKEVLLNFLQNESGWVFLPEQILVFWFDIKSNSFQPFGKEILLSEKETPGTHCNYRVVTSKNKINTTKILINIIVKKNIPVWHPAKGEHAWMFIDEIKVY